MRMYLEAGCLTAGILCFFYYLFILAYAGFTTNAAWIWPAGGVFFLLLWKGMCLWREHPGSVFRWIMPGCILISTAGIILIAFLAVLIMTGDGSTVDMEKNGSNYVIVLGAHVKQTGPSKSLRERLDCAAAYLKEHPDTILILSGGKGADEPVSEAECMWEYLTALGIDEHALIKEDASTNTRENLLFSARFLDQSKEVGIISNSFHVYRALQIAKACGYQKVFGIKAFSDPFMLPHNLVRETFAYIANKMILR